MTSSMNEGDDEMTVPNHPHVNQRNWQPGDDDADFSERPSRRVMTTRSALRTLARLRELTAVPPEKLVEAIYGGIEQAIKDMNIKPRLRIDQLPGFTVAQIFQASSYLEKVAKCIDKKMREGKWKCAECGEDVWAKIKLTEDGLVKELRYVRRDARYCSQACRQKAFRKRKHKRKRVTAKASNTKAKPSRVTALSSRRAA